MAAVSSSAAAARFSWEKKRRGRRRWPKRKGFSGPVGLIKA